MAYFRSTSLVSSSALTAWLLLGLQFTALCSAQSTSSSTVASLSSATSSAPAQTHTVQVGLADHKFNPDITKAAIGDTVEFRFFPANHSIVRAEYGYPCIPYEMTGPNKTGFFSGFNAADKVVEDPPKYSIKINDTQPIFFYCSAPGSCLTYGMVGAINPTNSTTIANQQSLAKKSAYMLNPGEPFPPEAPLPSDVPNAIPSGITLPSAPASKKASLSAGAIAGIVIGALSVIVLAALLFFFWGRTKSLKDEVERKESKLADSSGTQQQPHPDPAPFQQYSMVQSQAMSPHAQSYHGHNASVSSAGYFSPTHTNQQQQPHQGQEHKYTSPTMAQHPAFSNPGQMSPRTYELPHASLQSPPSQRSGSPHCLSLNTTQTPTLGPYGIERAAGPAPPYGYHVNSQIGPQEMDGTPVGKESEGREKGESERVQERGARWEEVKGDEGRMF